MASVITGIDTRGGVHCETTALGVLLRHAGVELSEAALFGLGSGLSFIYWDSKRQELPFIGGRIKPMLLTRNVAKQMGFDLHVSETTSAAKAWHEVRAPIDAGTPVGLQLDSYDLDYFHPHVHFAGHVVAMYGYDDRRALLVDTAQQGGGVTTSLENLAAARSAHGPMAAKNLSFTIPESLEQPSHTDLGSMMMAAAVDCARAFLSPPIANLGGRGIGVAAKRIPGWYDRVAEPAQDLPVIADIMERGGTGGGLFRLLYRDFLTELLEVDPPRAVDVRRARDLMGEAAAKWTRVTELIEQSGTKAAPDLLDDAAQIVGQIAGIETKAMELISGRASTPS